MDTLKTRAAELAAFGAEMTAEQAEELRSITAQIETINANAALAARAVELAAVADVAVEEEAVVASAGDAFIRSSAFAGYDGRGKSSAVDVRAFTGTNDLVIKPSEITVASAQAPLPLTGLVGRESVSTDAVVYTVSTFDSNAAAVAEGDVKPESFYSEVEVTTAVPTIAHHSSMSRQALSDAPRLASKIDNELVRGLAKKVEDEVASVIVGGTYNTANDMNILAAIRKAIALVEATGFAPNTIVLNPTDAADLDVQLLMANNNGATRNSSFWGLRVVTSSAVTEGQAFVGDFTAGVTLFDRQSTEIFLTDSHEGNFTKNIITVLAETRVGVAVTNAKAIAKANKGTGAQA